MRVSWYGHACFHVGPLEGFFAHRAGDAIVRHDGSTVELAALPDALTVHVPRPLLDPLVAP